MGVRSLRVLLVPLGLLTACAPASAPASPAPASDATPQRAANQRLVVAYSALWSTLDPTTINIGRAYDIFETLVIADPQGKNVEPLLATSWQMLSPTTWEFKLRPNSKWHDGSTVTATDVKWSFDHYTDPALRSPIATRIPLFESAQVVDPATVRLTTRQPDPIFLRAVMDVPILPSAYYERVGAGEFRTRPVGSGPWQVREYRPEDRVVLVPFPEHPTKKPIFTEVVVRAIPEASARVAGLRTGELDLISDIAPDQAETLKREGIQIISTPIGQVWGFWMDSVIEGSPTTDRRVRLAINYAIDRQAIVKNIYRGFQDIADGQVITRETFGYNPNLKPYPYDPKRARELLAEAGYPNGFKTQMSGRTTVATNQALLQFVQANLRDVGIEAEIVSIPPGTGVLDRFIGTVPREPLFFIEISTRPALDASFAFTWFLSTNPGANGTGTKHYNNPRFDELFRQSQTELDARKREQLLQQLSQILHEDPPYVPLLAYNQVSGVRPEIRGIIFRVTDIPDLIRAFRTQ
ncbi:MAG: hypothetical protein K6U89_07245 [Chloroflexi bacterium]|nr:hypothetical protein [Chloroflexota bacterium]